MKTKISSSVYKKKGQELGKILKKNQSMIYSIK